MAHQGRRSHRLRPYSNSAGKIQRIACWPISFLGSSGLTGGQIDADGNITDVGIITMEMIEIGKNGYLIALQNSKVI